MIIAGLIILGLAFGSFVNALVWRLHKQETTPINHKRPTKNQKPTPKNQLSIVSGRSMCVNCKHELAAKDLIPVLSWLWLKGKCRYCAKPISWQYPAVEAATAALFVISYLFWPAFQGAFQGGTLEIAGVVDFGVWLVMVVGFMALVVYDLRWMILPNKIIFPLIVLAGLNVLVQSLLTSGLQPLISSLWGVLIASGLFYGLFQVSGGRWIGGGDVKLGFLLGILVGGPAGAFLTLFLASLIGTLYSMPLLINQKLTAKTKVPFGPFLIIGAIIVKLFGQNLIDWYAGSFLF